MRNNCQSPVELCKCNRSSSGLELFASLAILGQVAPEWSVSRLGDLSMGTIDACGYDTCAWGFSQAPADAISFHIHDRRLLIKKVEITYDHRKNPESLKSHLNSTAKVDVGIRISNTLQALQILPTVWAM